MTQQTYRSWLIDAQASRNRLIALGGGVSGAIILLTSGDLLSEPTEKNLLSIVIAASVAVLLGLSATTTFTTTLKKAMLESDKESEPVDDSSIVKRHQYATNCEDILFFLLAFAGVAVLGDLYADTVAVPKRFIECLQAPFFPVFSIALSIVIPIISNRFK